MTGNGHRECVACASASSATTTFDATERLLGTREVFRYWQCEHCGCLQIAEIPADLHRHYPASYFAFKPQHRLAASRLRRWLDPHRLRDVLGHGGLVGRLANRWLKPLDYGPWCRITGLGQSARALDVGCGAGKLLLRLRHAGFAYCLGLDPFVAQPLRYANGVEVLKQGIVEFSESSDQRFDLVMFQHSFEHLPGPVQVLRAAARLLAPSGWMLLRLPVSGTYAWRTYRENWFQLDPPRHLFVPSVDAMRALAARAGLEIAHVLFDSTPSQFIVSELYSRDICMTASEQERNIFDASTLEGFARRTAELNAQSDGDQAAFFLRNASRGEAGRAPG